MARPRVDASYSDSNLPAVIRPVQQRLPLALAAGKITLVAVHPDLPDVAAERLPALDLPRVVLVAAAHIVAAVPLKPAARIVLVQPALALPFGERLACIDLEVVERVFALARRRPPPR